LFGDPKKSGHPVVNSAPTAQGASARGSFLGKKMGLKIESSKTNEGERVYRLTK